MKTAQLFIWFLLISSTLMASDREKQILQFIENELKYYPKAQLSDLYKNYFQDAYGPGHMIPDTTKAGNYLDSEMKEAVWVDTLLWQPLGINHDYYRINLSLIKNGIIPRNILLNGMVESAISARNPDIESWKKEWAEIVSVVKAFYPEIPGLNEDEKIIEANLSKGIVVMHHSKVFEEQYQPHYRLIHRNVFKRWENEYFNALKKK